MFHYYLLSKTHLEVLISKEIFTLQRQLFSEGYFPLVQLHDTKNHKIIKFIY